MARKQKITRGALMAASLRIVDQEGLDALSMRRLGDELGVEAMSLYRHVSNKAALLDGLHEAVLGGLRPPRQIGDWVEDCRALARSFRRALRAHPNVLPLFATRPAVTPGSLDHAEFALRLLAAPFPKMKPRVHALQALVTFVVGNTMSQVAASGDGSPPDYDDLPGEQFPILSTVGPTMARYSLDHEFEFGLDALLEGLRALSRRGR